MDTLRGLRAGLLVMRVPATVMCMALAAAVLPMAAQSPEPLLGTWMVNLSRSNYGPGVAPPKLEISTWEPWQGALRVTTYTVSAAGAVDYQAVATRMDGVDTPVEGVAAPTTRAYRRTGRTAEGTNYEYVQKVNGQITVTTRHTVSPDGNTRTSVDLTNASGGALRTRVFNRVR